MLSWAGKPLPRNVFGGSYSKYVEFGSGVWQGRTEGAAAPALTARPSQARALGWQLTPYAAASGGFLAVSVLRHAWRPKCSGKRNSPANSIPLSTKHWRYRPRRLRERIERCPQVRKSAPVRAHGEESVREPTTGTLAS